MSQLPSSSTSSTGHVDGLGRRSLSFDRVTGAVLERLHLRPELTMFEQVLRRRVESLASLDDDRFARPSAVERDPATGELTVVAEFVTGTRLSDLLETSAEAAVVPGVDVALGYLLETLPALSGLHTLKRVTHGLIDPSRTVLTTEGQVVLLDVAVGPAIERLTLSPARLWEKFGVAGSPAPDGSIRFDPTADVTQAALSALMLILGRNLRAREYPGALSSLLLEVIEVAQIRGSSNFAGSLQRFFQRALPLPDRRPYATADEALRDVRQLVSREIGAEVCHQAVIDFVDNMDAVFTTSSANEIESAHESELSVPELDRFLDDFQAHMPASKSAPLPASPFQEPEANAPDEEANTPDEANAPDEDEVEISLDNLDGTNDQEREKPYIEEVYELPPLEPDELEIVRSNFSTRPTQPTPSPFADVQARLTPTVNSVPPLPPVAAGPPPPPGPEFAPVSEAEPEIVEAVDETPAIAAVAEGDAEPEKESASSRRKKRQQQRSARARKDKLRSSTADQKIPTPEPVAAKPASPTGWLVSPQRSSAFDPVLPDPPAPMRTVPLPAVPSFTPSPVGHLPQPVYTAPAVAGATPAYGTPMISPHPPAPSPLTKEPTPAPTIKVKPNPPSPSTARKTTIAEPIIVQPPVERYGTMAPLGLGHSSTIEEPPRQFPWKLAAVALLVAVGAILAGRSYLPGRPAVTGEPGARPATATTPTPTPAPAVEDTPDSGIASGRGRLVVTTQPAGIKVLIDKKPAGDTPLNVDLPAGRHTLTFITSGGEVVRPVRIVAGKPLTLDIPVFSGWLSVVAPIILDVAENGQSIGSTEQNRLTLPPGHHQLTLSNKDLGYSAVQEVEIEPGGVKSVTVEPKGTVNLNASPWAEVWLDGQKLGDTPLVTQVPLGIREFLFKHPQRGERRQSATIRANATTPVSVDFNK